MTDTVMRATFAGGCFWCMVEPFDERPGIISVVSGYTGGDIEYPTYEQVCTNKTGHLEAVQITFNPAVISYEDILKIYWQQIDPTDGTGQFHDRGESYEPAIFYHNENQKVLAEKSKKALNESGKFTKPIAVKIRKSTTFYPAEESHQDYYKKNRFHYESYKKGSGRAQFIADNWKPKYDKAELKKRLTPIQYHVTMESGTERPFENEYWNQAEEGIYVDIISGELLFTTKEQFDANCGWPSFTKPIVNQEVTEHLDLAHGMRRIEVRSKTADSHLGHVFEDGPKEHGGLRYCINSAALKFIKIEDMLEEGYGKYLYLFE